MKRLACVVFLAACANEPGTELPVQPGGGSAGITSGEEGDDGAMFRGRVCVIESLFNAACATANAENLVVTLGDQTAITNAAGEFTMNTPFGTGLSFNVSGPDVVTTSQALNIRRRINVLRQSAFDQMLTINDVVPAAGTGSIIATVTRGGVPVPGVTATSTPAASFGPFFDGGSDPMPWTINATGVNGIVWFPGVMAGPAELSFNTGTGGSAIVGGIQVINGGITMVETPLP